MIAILLRYNGPAWDYGLHCMYEYVSVSLLYHYHVQNHHYKINRYELEPKSSQFAMRKLQACPISLYTSPQKPNARSGRAGIQTNSKVQLQHILQHGLQVISDLERSLGLGLHLLDGNAVGDLDQGQAVSEVDIEHAEVGDDAADAGRSGQRELTLLDDLGVALLVGVLHGHDDLGGGRVGDEVHGTAEALDLAGKHPW